MKKWMKMKFNSKAPTPKAVYEVSSILLIDLLTCDVQSTRVPMVDNAPLLKVFNEECVYSLANYDIANNYIANYDIANYDITNYDIAYYDRAIFTLPEYILYIHL